MRAPTVAQRVRRFWQAAKMDKWLPQTCLATLRRIQAIAQAGLTYSTNVYDIERYQELRDISVKLFQMRKGGPPAELVTKATARCLDRLLPRSVRHPH